MKWTTNKPTEPHHYYFFRLYKNMSRRIALVSQPGESIWVEVYGWHEKCLLDDFTKRFADAQWFGPIEEPDLTP